MDFVRESENDAWISLPVWRFAFLLFWQEFGISPQNNASKKQEIRVNIFYFKSLFQFKNNQELMECKPSSWSDRSLQRLISINSNLDNRDHRMVESDAWRSAELNASGSNCKKRSFFLRLPIFQLSPINDLADFVIRLRIYSKTDHVLCIWPIDLPKAFKLSAYLVRWICVYQGFLVLNGWLAKAR